MSSTFLPMIKRVSFTIIFLGIYFAISTSAVQAANYYWVGGSTNSNIDNPANWNTTATACGDTGNLTVPSNSDVVIFGSNCSNSATVNTSWTVSGFQMQNDYSANVLVNNSSLTATTNLVVNSGNLLVTNSGSVTAPSGSGSFIISDSSGSNGTITISGSGSQLNQTISGDTRLRIGNSSGSVGNLVIEDGATANTGNIYAGYATGSTGNITVDGADTVWNTDRANTLAFIGRQGIGNLTISSGAVVNSPATPWQIGGIAGSTGTVNITGSGSQLNMTGATANIRIGYSGTGSVTVQDGAVFNVSGTSGKITLADQLGSVGTLTIGTDYTLDLVSTTLGIFTGLGTASLPPNPPTSISSAVTQGTVDWSWESVAEATNYNIYSTADDSLLTTVSSTNWSQTLLSPSTMYGIYIRSANAQGVGYASTNASTTTSAAFTGSPADPNAKAMPIAPTCEADPPVGKVDLFQINRVGSSATLFFTPINGKVDAYNVIFGFYEGDEHFGGIGMPAQNENNGVQSIKVDHLQPQVSYYFKVIPVNGCAPGEWSNWLKGGKTHKNSIFYRY